MISTDILGKIILASVFLWNIPVEENAFSHATVLTGRLKDETWQQHVIVSLVLT